MSISKKWFMNGLCLFSIFVLYENVISQNIQMKPFHASFSAGLGLPKIPFAQFRAPVSVLGGASVNFRLVRKIALQIDGYSLHTFNLGTINNRNDELRFDLAWASVDLLRHIGGVISSESFIILGLGRYHLSRQYEDDQDMLSTTGLNIGFTHWIYQLNMNSILEIRWHLLFNPSDHPQVVSITFGLLL